MTFHTVKLIFQYVQGPEALPIFRSDAQGHLLSKVFLSPEGEWSLTELARDLGVSLPTILREVNRLERAGLVRSRKVGNTRLVTADTSSPLFAPMTELLLKSLGPPRVVGDEFRSLPGMTDVFVFGSWAARYLGESGPPPKDVDVLVLGRVDRKEAFQAAMRAERKLGRPVNVTVRSTERWQEGRDPFLRQLKSRPLVHVLPAEDSD